MKGESSWDVALADRGDFGDVGRDVILDVEASKFESVSPMETSD
jgi:hypothetical protein